MECELVIGDFKRFAVKIPITLILSITRMLKTVFNFYDIHNKTYCRIVLYHSYQQRKLINVIFQKIWGISSKDAHSIVYISLQKHNII